MNLIITMRLKILKHTINIKYKSKNNVSVIVIILLIVVFAVVGVFIPIRPPIKTKLLISVKIIGSVELQFIAVLIDSFSKYRISKSIQIVGVFPLFESSKRYIIIF